MDRYWKEVIQVSTRKHVINVQYLYDNSFIYKLEKPHQEKVEIVPSQTQCSQGPTVTFKTKSNQIILYQLLSLTAFSKRQKLSQSVTFWVKKQRYHLNGPLQKHLLKLIDDGKVGPKIKLPLDSFDKHFLYQWHRLMAFIVSRHILHVFQSQPASFMDRVPFFTYN